MTKKFYSFSLFRKFLKCRKVFGPDEPFHHSLILLGMAEAILD
jgi:hypothetical protein